MRELAAHVAASSGDEHQSGDAVGGSAITDRLLNVGLSIRLPRSNPWHNVGTQPLRKRFSPHFTRGHLHDHLLLLINRSFYLVAVQP
ncbi:hypothetical protein [Thermodesulforhabdus norvegica]|uniref:Uncharacterized protein n=1 Tax=Thermodesulforhabdus norvegica TaxID=39841 RepID=A0A1I4S2U4_9BACT|nr:hypothetical protein [Thermodesulforhabdus norvegica]SFM58775.1 hypothetical protein SAMN05660836_00717 [Thermodesulforhabdus norvegica]